MKTSWILLATLAPMLIAGCGGQAASDANGKDQVEEGATDEASEEADVDEAEPDEGIGGDEETFSEDVDQDGDVDEQDEQLARVSEVLDIDLEDVDGDGDVDVDDLADIAKEEYDVDEEELDVTGDGTFDEKDLQEISDQIEEGVITPETVSRADSVDVASSGGVAVATPVAGPIGMVAPPRGVPLPAGPGNTSIPDLGECEEQDPSQGPDYCDVSYSCESGYMWGNCWNEGTGVMYCSCGGEGETGFGYADYQLTEVSISEACGTLMDLCTSEVQPDFSGEPECVPEYQSASDEWCDMSMRCSKSAELEGGATALLSEYESVNCSSEEEGGPRRCECYGPQGSMSFELADGKGIEPCLSALDICDSADSLEPEGDPECEFAYQSAGQNWCEAQMSCIRTATTGDVTVDIAEMASTNCQLVSEGVWQCGCYSSAESNSFEFESTASAWDTCTEAVELCGQ